MPSPPGMPRSNFAGFRYKPIKLRWVDPDPEKQNLLLKQEFENIAAGINDLAARAASAESGLYGAMGGGEKKGEDTDRLVALVDADDAPDVLLEKMRAGAGITFTTVAPGRKGGPFVVLSTSGEVMECWVVDFNSYLDADGNVITDTKNPLRTQMTFLHGIQHEHYLFDIYRPIESTQQPDTVDLHGDGTDRGRFQIRWKNIERKPGRLTVWFHQPEFGTIVIYGSRTVRTGQVYRVPVD